MSLRSHLDATANVVSILACVLMSSFVFLKYLDGRNEPTNGVSPSYKQNETMDAIGSVDFGGANATLILYVSSTCRFCTDSMQFYQRLSDLRGRRQNGLRIVAVSHEPVDSLTAYLNSHDVKVDQIVSFDTAKTRFRGTPTLVLIRRGGKVVNEWRGQMPVSRETDVIKTVTEVADNS